MRWSNLSIDAGDGPQAALPGYRDGATVRHFDAPEAMDTRFYEVRAKSALNEVPKQSQVPFRWTINPYRGCSHACVYCQWGDAKVLMADGRTRRLADLRRGDRIMGTDRRGAYRRLRETEVRDHWSVVKPAYRTRLADGTELITSGEHRFLAHRGWKHVAGAPPGEQRPHLTTNDELLGTGRFFEAPFQGADYREGYLCGLIRGDGHVGRYGDERPGRKPEVVHGFRLALCDLDALDRVERYLSTAGVATSRFAFHAGSATTRAAAAIRTQATDRVDAVEATIRWPLSPGDDWCKGFLAGIFDAEGSGGREAFRLPNTDPLVLAWFVSCLERFGFRCVTEPHERDDGLRTVRLLGGLPEQLRFFQLTDPAIRRKLRLEGRALKTSADLRVVSVEPLGVAMRLFDLTTGTGDYIADGVVSHNCFARPTHQFLGFDAGRDFEREIVVKVNLPEVLRAELARPSWGGEHVALGTNTDPYQWVEGRYRLMPGIWEALRDAANPCSILTKSPLVTRDIPLLQQIAERAPVSANLSIPTLDEKAWRATEPHTPNPRARLEAVRALNDAGIPTGILVAPLMPGINDGPGEVERILELASDAGATGVGGIALHLRGETRDVFMDWLRTARPDLVERYERLYARGAYAPRAERERLQRRVRDARAGSSWPPSALRDHRGLRRPGGRDGPERAASVATEEVHQGSLF